MTNIYIGKISRSNNYAMLADTIVVQWSQFLHDKHRDMAQRNISMWQVIWGLCCQNQVSQAVISNNIPQLTPDVITFLPEIPASDNKVHIYVCQLTRYRAEYTRQVPEPFLFKNVFPNECICVFKIRIYITYIIHDYLSCAQNTDPSFRLV